MEHNNLHNDLSVALRLFNITLTDWSASLKRPNGTVGVSAPTVIRCAQGKEPTPWLREKITDLIRASHATFPGYYLYHARKQAKADHDPAG